MNKIKTIIQQIKPNNKPLTVNEMVQHSLNKYHFQLTPFGIECISFQVELLHGKHPTLQQVDEIVKNNKISYINEHKKGGNKQ